MTRHVVVVAGQHHNLWYILAIVAARWTSRRCAIPEQACA